MHWTTVCDLPFAGVDAGWVADVSGRENNAQVIGGVTVQSGVASFHSPDGQLVVPVADESLQRFDGVMIGARIRPSAADRRQDIVEGWMSFAFYLEPDGRLIATIYDGQDWVAVESQPDAVPLDQWSDVTFEYDGICVGVLRRDGAVIGSSLRMPLGMRQPNQNVTLGHWPSGDDRYTFAGDMGRVTIWKRDYEDVWQDAVDGMWCNRRLSTRQASALKELAHRVGALAPETVARLRECAAEQVEGLHRLLRAARLGNPEMLRAHHDLGRALLAAWCCGADVAETKSLMRAFLENQAGAPGSDQRPAFVGVLEELARLDDLCGGNERSLTALRELFLEIVPEFESIEGWADHVVDGMGRE